MSDTLTSRLLGLWNWLNQEGWYTRANTVSLAIDERDEMISTLKRLFVLLDTEQEHKETGEKRRMVKVTCHDSFYLRELDDLLLTLKRYTK